MIPQSKKRKLPAASGPAPKRSRSLKPTTPKGKASTKRAIDVASLSWKPVGEDFGGLEVITGVDVVKDGDKVQFVVRERDDGGDETHNDGNGDKDTDGDRGKNTHERQDEAESFEGFGDDPVEGQDVHIRKAGSRQDGVASQKASQQVASQGEPKTNKKDKKDKKKKPLPQDKQATDATADKVLSKPPAHGGNSFGALAELAQGDQEDDAVDLVDWVALNLSPRILSGIAKLGFAKPTAIQTMAIPEIMAGEDVIGKAQTGSGKTLAFGIPVVEKWLETHDDEQAADGDDTEEKSPMALVLSPTRELAKQLGDHLKALCDGLAAAPYVCVVTGGLSIQKQQRQLAKADIIIGTPGRLWEVMDGDMALQESLTCIKFLVVDEADRLFKVGQFKEAEDIIGALDRRAPEAGEEDDEGEDELPPRQTLVFSATFDKDLQTKLAGKGRSGTAGTAEDKMAYLMKCLKFRREPKFLDANPVSQLADKLREGLIECGAMEKDLYLYAVLVLNPGRRTLVFTNSISAVRRLTPLLSNLNLTVLPLHSQMAQKARMRSLERFTESRNSILVATDVAARGLDIDQVEQVIHYHVPRTADTYIHRSGRTARGERGGVSVLLCSPEEVLPTRRLAAKVHAKRSSTGARRQHVIQALPVDRKVAARLRPRVDLSKRLADAVLAKEKAHGDEAWLRAAAEDLGVEYDADDFDDGGLGGGRGGRGGGRKRKEKEARALSKAEMGALRAQLREELSRRVNLGVSERYITGGRVDVAALLREREAGANGIFLGGDNLGLGL
ncbi:DEAD/DEAH box helicase [Hirsutella rhossiliensis]|uniref:ATP-dependent RNA helicase n=1 Tax=Hirsutella rhossiliensis TaxID=111463 RepID=A0A9P8MLL6_9HYPO|nr:DEAD/DEAH box helicase domain-containing protein [Hirsutella rhossiliensis]KAH0957587.1 DEAD/DEAH box helicase domain-containing protein [Hirsutella rhossiliensis]